MALPITDELVARAAARLSEGGWMFTLRQLYYAACSDAETPRSRRLADGEIGAGVLVMLVALVLLPVRPAFVGLATLSMLLIVMGVVGRTRTRSPAGRVLAMSYQEFQERFAQQEIAGLLQDDSSAPVPARSEPVRAAADSVRARPGTVLVCDTRETATVVAANLATAGIQSLNVLGIDSVPDPLPWTAVAVVHDASPRGCSLSLELKDRGAAQIVDCGLRPSEVDSPATQLIEGAPARLPRDLSSALSALEIAWLASGRRVELATLSPRQLFSLLREKLGPAE